MGKFLLLKRPKWDGIDSNILELIKKSILADVDKVKKRINKTLKNRQYISSDKYFLVRAINKIGDVLNQGKSLRFDPTPKIFKGDVTVPCFDFASSLGKNPNETSDEFSQKIREADLDFVQEISVEKAYINISFNRQKLFEYTIKEIEELDALYGANDKKKKGIMIIDYSSPNVAKPFSVGHLRTTIIGEAIKRLYEFTGSETVSDNHLGDWGTQFGKVIYAYEQWGDEEKFKNDSVGELFRLYVLFGEKVKENPELQDEARKIFKKIEEKDEKYLGLWAKFREAGVLLLQRIYKTLGINFNLFIGESFYEDYLQAVVDDFLKNDIGYLDRNLGSKAVIVDLEKEGLGTCLIRKTDGGSLYHTRDLATLKFKKEKFNPSTLIYVVGKEQTLYFQQLFVMADKIGYMAKDKCIHIGFGLVLAGGTKMSTRNGGVITFEDLVGKIIARCKQIICEKNTELSDKEVDKIAQTVGLGTVIYNDLRQDPLRDINFDWERRMDLKHGLPYVLYTCVRIGGILRELKKSKIEIENKEILKLDETYEVEYKLVFKLSFFPKIIEDCISDTSVVLLAIYVEELAQLFNSFYESVSVKEGGSEYFPSRVRLIKCVYRVIQNALNILNIEIPERM